MVAPSSPPQASLDPIRWRHAQAWAQAHAPALSADADRDRVAALRLAHQDAHARRVGLYTWEGEGRTVLFGVMGTLVYAIEEGQIWAWDLTHAAARRLLRARSIPQTLWRAYQAHRARPHVHALDRPWFLRLPHRHDPSLKLWTLWAWRNMMEAWLKDEVDEVFAEANAQGVSVSPLSFYDLDPDQRAHQNTANDLSMAAHRHAIHHVLRGLRRALPRPVRVALWGRRSKALFRADLAHWLMKEGPDRVHYRAQALDQQPILLPLALQASGQWPMNFSSPATKHRTLLQPQLDRGEALTTAIDQGQPWLEPMVTILRQEKTQAWLLHGGGRWQPHTLNHPGMAVTAPLARHLQHSTRDHLPSWEGIDYLSRSVEVWGQAWAGLSQPRRPTSPQGSRQLVKCLSQLVKLLAYSSARHHELLREADVAGWVGRHLNGFLKGLPEDWCHPIYANLLTRWKSLTDTVNWMSVPVPGRTLPSRGELMARLTWQQWDNFLDRAHDHEVALRPAWVRKPDEVGLHWPGGRQRPLWQWGEVCIHELTDERALEEEGEQMCHCIAGSGMACAGGDVREFSVRTAEGQRLSTLEVSWHAQEGRPRLEQHVRAENQSPPPLAVEAVEHFLAERTGWCPGPWEPTAEHARRLAEWARQRHEQEAREILLSQRLWDELDRRYPARKRA